MFELPKSYDPASVEEKWYQYWLEKKLFHADPASDKTPYCIVIPPPNVTGVLHMGHALVNTLQDILIRWKRMLGFEALWVPGTDHAGISTQTVVEKHLIKTMGKRRKDFGRDEFLEHVWSWKQENEGKIVEQLKRLGCSCDWDRSAFTMDEARSRAVRTMFKKLFDDGLIYRGDYLVNWDPVTQTALADDEVEYEDRDSFFWHFRYPVKDSDEYLVIATTRPETMLGDTAVAVSPKDPRYAHLVGKTVILPLMNREIPVIADRHVDPEFGTGALKITPAHDPNDYQIGISHDLPFVNMMTPDGRVNENGGEFLGLTMAEAREAVVEKMKDLGLLEKIEPHAHRVGISYRSKAVIEPFMSKQWFVRMDGFAKRLRALVEQNKVKLVPKNWESTYFHWIDNLRDWCISRQLWWGHRIPIWYRKDNPEQVICFDGEGVPPEVAAAPDEWDQEEDVLDTWFSSQLWPFSTLGWPEKTAELEKFYPNSVLVTGHDILFFWVARMILAGDYIMDEAPFPETFLHGLIYGKSYWRQTADGAQYVTGEQMKAYDEGREKVPADVCSKWEKMSKSKGNIIDPIEIMDQYGTDAMRMALCASSPQSRQIDLDRRRFEDFQNFANKIWNGARFVFMNLEASESGTALTSEAVNKGLDESLFCLEDRWILSVLNRTIAAVNKDLESYAFDRAASAAYDFFWREFCAYYVEISKPYLFGKAGTPELRENKQKLLVIVLCHAIRLLHPMAPYITEELFQLLKQRFDGVIRSAEQDVYTQDFIEALSSSACMVAPFSQVLRPSDRNESIDETFDLLGKVVYAVRNIRGEMKLTPGATTDLFLVTDKNSSAWKMLEENETVIRALVRIKEFQVLEEAPKLGFSSTAVVGDLKIMIPLPDEMRERESKRLMKEKERLEKNLEKVRSQLNNENFVSRAPQELIEKQRSLLANTESELAAIEQKLHSLQEVV
ncbi:MAG: valine--tRNA ligase [Waddliaceae bacterium]|nr:valine--tRNA ligase [Waddliaceae bacterium]